MKNFKYILTIILASTIIFTSAQDLIKDTQNGSKTSNTAFKTTTGGANAIFKNIEAISKTENFVPSKLFKINSNKRDLTSKYENTVSGAVFLDLSKSDLAKINQQKPRNVSFLLPVNESKNIELLLTESDFMTEDFIVRTADGKLFDFKNEGGLFYQGVVKGDPNSLATVSIFNNNVRAIISDNNGNYVLGALGTESNYKKANTYVTNSNKYILFNDYNLVRENDFICGNNDTRQKDIEKISKRIFSQTENNLSQVEKHVPIYIECDYSAFVETFGSSTYTAYNYLTSLFNETTILFAIENVNIKLSELYIQNSSSLQNTNVRDLVAWANANIQPDNFTYTDGRSARGEILDAFTHYIQNDFNGRLAHLIFAIKNYDGTPKSDGIASPPYLGNAIICQDYNGVTGPTAVSSHIPYIDAFPNFTRDLYVFAHEIGHNFGLPHAWDCVWGPNDNKQLDDCNPQACGDLGYPPALMSSCQNHPLSNAFGKLPGDLMRYYYNNPCVPNNWNNITEPTISGNLDCRGDIDIFSEFPTLSNYVNPNNCDGERISIWVGDDSGYWKYIYIIDDSGGTLYVSDGGPLNYLATDNGDYSMIEWYLDDGARNIANWSCDCCIINISNFETDFGIWNDGGAHCWRWEDNFADGNTNNDFAGSGKFGALLRWNKSSSLITTDAIDLNGIDDVYVGFSFIGHVMEGNERFRLQISTNNGVSFSNVKQWIFKPSTISDSANQYNVINNAAYSAKAHSNVRYAAYAKISTYDLTNNTKFRFRLYGDKRDYVILDNIAITTCAPPGNGLALIAIGKVSAEDLNFETKDMISLYPDPANNILNFNIEGMDQSTFHKEMQFEIYSIDGRIVKEGILKNTDNLRIDISQLAGNQTYLIKVQTGGDEIFTDKFVKN